MLVLGREPRVLVNVPATGSAKQRPYDAARLLSVRRPRSKAGGRIQFSNFTGRPIVQPATAMQD